MMRNRPGHGRWALVLGAMLAAAAGVQMASAANLSWNTRGNFEACLEGQANDWIGAKAELIANDDPAASDLDDMDVALWAVAALQGCEERAGHGNQTSEHQFSRHMAHWREHIHSVAQTVRRRAGAD